MKNIGLFAGALLATSALTAPAFAGDIDFTVEGFAAVVDTSADYINADKPDNDLSGVLGGYRIGVEYTFGSNDGRGVFVGANYYATATDALNSGAQMNGNALWNEAELEGFSGYEFTVGYDFGSIAVGVGYGELEADSITYQNCAEDHEIYTASFCGAGGNDVVGDQREGLRGGSPMENSTEAWRLFGRYDVNDNIYITASYLNAEFGQSVAPLDVIDNAANDAHPDRTAHPATSYALDLNGTVMVGFGLRL